jgi:GTPase SAR1 family protein
VFIGPTGSGKSSLIGSLVRAVTEVAEFPARIQMTLNHPGEDSHGTIMWLETRGNRKESILYQDTRGDQVSNVCVWYIYALDLSISIEYVADPKERRATIVAPIYLCTFFRSVLV